jgi:aryl-alcohol dehydrogenase-like predicted oxidoreductase
LGNFSASCSRLLLARGAHVVPIPGTKRRQYLEENLGAAQPKERAKPRAFDSI